MKYYNKFIFSGFYCLLIIVGAVTIGYGQNSRTAGLFSISSPDGLLNAKIQLGDGVTYSLTYKGNKVLSPSSISMNLGKVQIGINPKKVQQEKKEVRETIHPVLGDFSNLANNYNTLRLDFKGHYSIVFRAYNSGFAYRFITDFADSIKVLSENAEFNLAERASAVAAVTDNFTAWELPYENFADVSQMAAAKHAITPALFSFKQPHRRIIIAESDLENYPGMYLQTSGAQSLRGLWANYPAKTTMGSWGNFVSVVRQREPFIAKTIGKRSFPWRVVMVTDDDKTLLTNKLIYLLARPTGLKITNWIKPGKAAWEWWHDALLPGANIPSGMDNRNTALYDYYVDFAAKNKLAYMMVDAGWSNVYDIQKPNPKIDMVAVIQHAKQKNVGVFLWCVASSLLKDLDGNMDYLKSLGAAGLKVDFFDRDDQEAISWMERIAASAASRHLLIDFHGCSKPTGLERAFPNIVNYEAVRGAECDKWDTTANPEHHLTIPFIRMLAGPMDYTPGAMRNKTKSAFKPVDKGLPSSMGTRCHELAMYILFDQPLAMLCDAPTAYEKYPDILGYLSRVPTTFDDSKALDGAVGEYAVLAKRKGADWYVGAMTDWASRDVQIDLSFLTVGKVYQAEVFKDAKDADTNAEHYNHEVISVTSNTKLALHLAPGGGAALYIHP